MPNWCEGVFKIRGTKPRNSYHNRQFQAGMGNKGR